MPEDGSISESPIAESFQFPSVANSQFVEEVVTNGTISWTVNEISPSESVESDGIFPHLLQKGLEILFPCGLNRYTGSAWHYYLSRKPEGRLMESLSPKQVKKTTQVPYLLGSQD